MRIAVNIPGNVPVDFDIDENGRGRPFFIFGIRKCGSTLLNKICQALARANSVTFVDVAGTFFKHNINVGAWVNEPAVKRILRPGNAYGGFRNLPTCLQDTAPFSNSRKVLLVRDPRDALVSEYFSNAYSHALPDGADEDGGARRNLLAQRQKALATPIDDYVKSRAPLMRRTFLEYRSVWSDAATLGLRYERIIFEKPKLVSDIAGHFRWACSASDVAEIIERVDVMPVAENPTAFIRKVTPGDHTEKLSPETIDFLNAELRDVLDLYGYATG